MEADEIRPGGHRRRLEAPWVQRGSDLTRLLALSDGIFAFAMTLLVLGLALPVGFDPHNVGQVLVNLRGAFLSYAFSFLVIWFYWLAHNQVFGYIQSYDRRLQQLNVTFLLFIAVMPFVTNLLASAGGETITVVLYAAVQVAAGGSLSLLWFYATHERRHVASGIPESWISYTRIRTSVAPLVFAVSIPIAFVSPSIAEYSWISLFFAQAFWRYLQPKRADANDHSRS